MNQQEQSGWVGAYAVLSKRDGTEVCGRVIGLFRNHAGRYLRLACDWGTTEIPLDSIVAANYS